MISEEIWKDITGCEGLYKISNYGRVLSLNFNHTNKEKLRKLTTDVAGYKVVCLRKNGFKENKKVHRLVMEHFVENVNSLPIINHKDEDKTNNNVDNLEWCDCKYNINYGNGIFKRSIKSRKPVIQFDKNGNFIKRWDSALIAEQEMGYCNSHINQCCNGKRKYHKNSIWKFENEV